MLSELVGVTSYLVGQVRDCGIGLAEARQGNRQKYGNQNQYARVFHRVPVVLRGYQQQLTGK
jgi:hypothetical protein